MKCVKCGNEINVGDNFCISCGEPVSGNPNNQNVGGVTGDSQVNQNIGGVVNNNPVNQNVAGAVDNNPINQPAVGNNDNNVNVTNQGAVSNEPVIVQSSPVNVNNGVGVQNTVVGGNVKSYAERNSYKPLIITMCSIIPITLIYFIVMFILVFNTIGSMVGDDKLVCKSDSGNVTIGFSRDQMVTYSAVKYDFDFDEQKKVASRIGKDAYIEQFNNSFVQNTTNGSCTYNNKIVGSGSNYGSGGSGYNNYNNISSMTIGDSYYGYVDVPNNWTKFYDVSGTTALQYSYANVFIFTMDVVPDKSRTAKEYASNYYNSMANSSEIVGLTAATVHVGNYEAYQVYMLYPASNTYLITYWFTTDDGYTHYMALEGPEEMSGIKLYDLTSIPESFRLKK